MGGGGDFCAFGFHLPEGESSIVGDERRKGIDNEQNFSFTAQQTQNGRFYGVLQVHAKHNELFDTAFTKQAVGTRLCKGIRQSFFENHLLIIVEYFGGQIKSIFGSENDAVRQKSVSDFMLARCAFDAK